MMTIKPLGTYKKDGGAKARIDYLLDQVIPTKADYYLNTDENGIGEPAGRWFGGAVKELGLDGPVLPNQLHGLMQGFDPRTYDSASKENEGLVERPGDHLLSGFDCSFVPPKTMSVAFAIETPENRAVMRQIFNESINTALKRMEKDIVTRRGKDGKDIEPVEGIFASVFEHTTARVPDMADKSGMEHVAHLMNGTADPHLHAHCIISNVCLRKDGTYGTIVSNSLFENQKLLGAVFRAELCKGLREKLGYDIVEGKSGTFEIAGIDEKTVQHFSKRHVVLHEWIKVHKDELDAKGLTGRRAEEYAWARTRKGKEEINRPALFKEWQADAKQTLGLDSKKLESLRGGFLKNLFKKPPKTNVQDIVAKASNGQSVFKLSKLEEELCKAAQFDDFNVNKTMKAVLESQDIFVLRDKDGKLFGALRSVVERESYIARKTAEWRHETKHRTTEAGTTAIVDKFADASRAKAQKEGWKFDERIWTKQSKAVHDLTRNTGGVAVLKGFAGAGKTTVMTCVRQVYEAHGFTVIGGALAGKAAENLQKEAEIQSNTLAGLLAKIEAGSERLTPKHIVVIDEAGMVDSELMFGLVKACESSGAKLVVLGEAEQLQPVGAGGIFRAMEKILVEKAADSGGVQVLDDITRQKGEFKWLTEAILDIRRGDGEKGLQALIDHDLLKMQKDEDNVVSAMVGDWFNDKSKYEKKLMIAGTRAECSELNATARALRREAGELKSQDFEVECRVKEDSPSVVRKFAVGERIAFFKKDSKLGDTPLTHEQIRKLSKRERKEYEERVKGVQNGVYATIEKIEPSRFGKSAILTVKLDDGRKVKFDTSKSLNIKPKFKREGFLDFFETKKYDFIDYAYAITVHKSQGQTVDQCYVKASDNMMDREWGYVAMSRSKGATTLYATQEQSEDLAYKLSKSRMKGTTLDYEVVDKTEFMSERGLDVDALFEAESKGKFDKKIETIVQAITWGSGEDIRKLMEADPEKATAEILTPDDKGNTALHLAAYKKNASAIEALIAAGAVIDAGNRMGITPLMDAARSCDAESVGLLLAHGADPFRVAKNGDSVFRFVNDLESKTKEVMEKAVQDAEEHRRQLDAATNDLERKDIQNKLSSIEATRAKAEKENLSAVAMIENIGKSKELTLEKAIGWRSNQAIRSIIADPKKREQVNKPFANGKTALHLAVAKKNAWAVKALLSAGANANAQDEKGVSVLMTAVRAKNPELVKLVLDAGANPRIADDSGKDAITVAYGVMKQAKAGNDADKAAALAMLDLVDPERQQGKPYGISPAPKPEVTVSNEVKPQSPVQTPAQTPAVGKEPPTPQKSRRDREIEL